MKRASPVRVMQVAVAVIVACANCGSRTALLAPEKSEPEPVICRSAYVALTSLSAAEGPPSLDSVAVDGTDAYVAYSAAAGLSVQHLDAEGTPIGTPQPTLAGVGCGPGYVAAGYGHRAFMANGGGFMGGPVGCWFVALGADAAPSGSPVLFDPGPCSWLVATPTGFVAIESL